MFSRKAIFNFEPVVQKKLQIVVQKKLQILCRGLKKFCESGSVCKLTGAFSAFAGDVVTNYCFGYDYDHLSRWLYGLFSRGIHGRVCFWPCGSAVSLDALCELSEWRVNHVTR